MSPLEAPIVIGKPVGLHALFESKTNRNALPLFGKAPRLILQAIVVLFHEEGI